jgi:methenyltetrahydrofolate cyclohydrolase
VREHGAKLIVIPALAAADSHTNFRFAPRAKERFEDFVAVRKTSMLVDLSIEEFSQVLGSDSPAPGGGSVAALSGALGADLVSMVCKLSVDKSEYEPFRKELTEALTRSEQLSKSLLARVDRDTEAFNGVMAAFKLPKTTDAEKKKRSEAIRNGYRAAVQSPLGIARECLEVLTLANTMTGKSNSNALSDLGVASQQAYAGLEGAVMNVKINIPSIKDDDFRRRTLGEVSTLLEKGRTMRDNLYEFVQSKLR